MKRTVWALLATATLGAAALSSCKTSSTSDAVLAAYGDTGSYQSTAIGTGTALPTGNAQKYPTFVADIDPIQLDEFFGMSLSFNKLKVKQISKFYFVPRSNNIEIYYRSGANSLCLIFGQQAREGIISAATKFIEMQEASTLVDAKPTSANAFYSGACEVFWGVATPANGTTKGSFHANCKFIDGLPYFVLRFPSTLATTSQNTYSPYEELYFSPTQLKFFCEQIQQENLQARVDEVASRAFVY